ncbi:MAG: iron-containing alcohol dehydrogenase [Aeromonadales bacterium]|nr:iron-containing alcohol dehydrogenase [Aeromonadales bacterium]
MEDFRYCVSTNYIFGQGQSKKTANVLLEYGYKKVLVVYGQKSAVSSGLLPNIEKQLQSKNIEYITLGGVVPNPRADLVYDGIELCKKEGVDFILAVGGGSVIDTAKAIGLGAKDDGDFFDFYLKKRKPVDSVKVGCVLTIAAAGSESSTSSVIQKEIDGKIVKNGCSTPLNRPLFAILDPELTYSLSAYQTACGVTDMMAHILERYFTNSKGVIVTDRICEGLLLSIIENAQIALANPNNYEARANLMWAGALAHNNLCGVDREQDWASHHLEHQLSALYDVAHGAGLAVIFPAWMDYVYKHDLSRFAQFAVRVFHVDMDYNDLAYTSRQGIKAFRSFLKKIGMPLSFKDIGAKKNDIEILVKMLGVDDDSHTEGKFIPLYREDCLKVYEIANDYVFQE